MEVTEYGKGIALLGEMLQDERTTITQLVSKAHSLGLQLKFTVTGYTKDEDGNEVNNGY